MTEWITAILLLLGGIFMLLGAVGVTRMPDLFMRLQAATKAAALGVACLFLAVAVHFGDLGVTTRTLLVIGFVFLTAPVSAHMIGRAAYSIGIPLWDQSVLDELREHSDRRAASTGAPPAARPPDPPPPV